MKDKAGFKIHRMLNAYNPMRDFLHFRYYTGLKLSLCSTSLIVKGEADLNLTLSRHILKYVELIVRQNQDKPMESLLVMG